MYSYLKLALIVPVILHTAVAGASTPSSYTDRLIVKMKSTHLTAQSAGKKSLAPLSKSRIASISTSVGEAMKYGRSMENTGSHVLHLNGFKAVDEVKKIAEQMVANDANIEYAEPDYLMYPTSVTPNDPAFVDQWHLQSSSSQGLNLPLAWEHTTGSSDVVVAVLDSGILGDHPDFDPARILDGYDFVSEDAAGVYASANDGDGRDSDPSDPGDWVSSAEANDISGPLNGCSVSVSSWHGTHVAGTIGATTDNNTGVSGVDWAAKILPVRVLGKCGGYTSDIADGIIWAAGGSVAGAPSNDTPADVINLSLGSQSPCSFTMQNAIDLANNSGTTVVAGAGNESTVASAFSPASCDNVIAVGAHDSQGNLSDFSNFGSTLDLLAPGGSEANYSCANSIISLLDMGSEGPVSRTYACYFGTSMAAPHVSGMAALMLSRNPNLTPAEIEQIIKQSARDFPSFNSGCFGSTCGAGIADAYAAVAASAIPYAPDNLIIQNNNGLAELSWQDNSELESGFKIEVDFGDGQFQQVFVTQSNIGSYTDIDSADGLLRYRVSAVNGDFSSNPTSTESIVLPFKTVKNVRLATNGNAITLSWQDVSNNETGVEIYRAQGNGEFELITTVEENSVNYVDENLLDGSFYRYQLRTINLSEQSDFVESEQIELALIAPSALQAETVASEIRLSWVDVSENEAGYEVQRSIDGISFDVIASLPANSETFEDTVNRGQIYHYRVRAISNKNEFRSLLDEPVADSEYSNQVSVQLFGGSSGSGGSISVLVVILLSGLVLYRRRYH